MRAVRVAEDIVPLGLFKGQAAHWLRHLAASGHPLIITQNGKPAGVLLSPSEFDRMSERQEFLEHFAAGVEDLEAGRVYETTEVRAHLRARRIGGAGK